MRVNVYVDGFNLYYGAIKGTRFHWLNLENFSRGLLDSAVKRAPLLRGYDLGRIRYFTARVDARPGDLGQPERQAAYIRALETIPRLTVHYGRFLYAAGRAPQEKGSDVNLATYLLLDAFDRDFDCALVVTNDSDLTHPVQVLRERFRSLVIVALPILNTNPDGRQRRASRSLQDFAHYSLRISSREKHLLRDSQFPDSVGGPTGAIRKPARWM